MHVLIYFDDLSNYKSKLSFEALYFQKINVPYFVGSNTSQCIFDQKIKRLEQNMWELFS
jgi:hypothetical protein